MPNGIYCGLWCIAIQFQTPLQASQVTEPIFNTNWTGFYLLNEKTRTFQGLGHKDQNKDKDQTFKVKDKDNDWTYRDKENDLKLFLKESLRTRTRTRTNILPSPAHSAPSQRFYWRRWSTCCCHIWLRWSTLLCARDDCRHLITQARRRHDAAQEDGTGPRRTEKLPTSVQLHIRVKAGEESGFLTSRLQPQCTRFDATAAVSIPTSS